MEVLILIVAEISDYTTLLWASTFVGDYLLAALSNKTPDLWLFESLKVTFFYRSSGFQSLYITIIVYFKVLLHRAKKGLPDDVLSLRQK